MAPVSAPGQPAAVSAEVAVRDVKFAKVRAPRGGDTWLEAAVELDVRAAPGSGTAARWADRVGVTLAIGIRNRDEDYSFFRSRAELVALEAGRAVVRFYLPPEIVTREQLGSTPFAYTVDLALGGREVDGGLVSRVLQAPEALGSFKDRVLQSAAANDGVLVPQYESPFDLEYGADTPSFVRRQR